MINELDSKGVGLLRFGVVSETDQETGRVRVLFDADGIVSSWLPVSFPAVGEDRFMQMPAVNSQAACLMDANCEIGVVVGFIYSNANPPSGFGSGERGVLFSDGSKITASADGVITVKGASKVIIEGASKVSIKNGADSLVSIVSDLIDAMLAETHPVVSVGSPTGTPINALQYAAIKTRINAMME